MGNLSVSTGIRSAHNGGEGTVALTRGVATSLEPTSASDRNNVAGLASDGPCCRFVRTRDTGRSAIICRARNAVSLVSGVA